jgi:hypothetical protein
MRLAELPPLLSLWSDSASSTTLAYLHQTLLKEYDIPARDLTVVHYQRLYDGYFDELERDVQRGEDRMWVMGMALEEGERRAARERAEGTTAETTTGSVEHIDEGMEYTAGDMEYDEVQNHDSRLGGTEAPMECVYSPVLSTQILEMEEGALPDGDSSPQGPSQLRC